MLWSAGAGTVWVQAERLDVAYADAEAWWAQRCRWEVAVAIVFETHSITTDNEAGLATGWFDGRLSAHGKALNAS
jgi:hypothetical protein